MTDISLTDEFEITEQDDEFLEGDSDDADANLIVILEKGELRYAPWLGFGIKQRIRAVRNVNRFVRELKVELENDGFVNPEVDVSAGFDQLKIYV